MLRPEELAEAIDELQELQQKRRDYIKAKNRIVLQAKASVRRALDWQAGDEESKREATNARAGKIADAFLGKVKGLSKDAGTIEVTAAIIGKVPEKDREIAIAMAPHLMVFRSMAMPAVAARTNVEKRMKEIARTLPGYDFVDSVDGFGDLTFAIIVGEAGDLGAYPAKGHLRKRLGLAPYEKDGEVKAMSTWARQGGLSKEDWIAAGYAPSRRAEIHACLAESMAKGEQLESGEKSGTKYGRPKGKYGEVYVRRRERTEVTHPDWQPARARMDALRKMSKVAIHDLWLAWRRDMNEMPERVSGALPAADEHVDGRRASSDVPHEEVSPALHVAQLNAA